MKKLVKKNQIIISAFAVMIVVARYLNFTRQEISTSGLVTSQQKETAQESKEDTAKAEETQAIEEEEESQSDEKDTLETSAETAEDEGDTDISAEDEGSDGYTVNDDGEVVASEENPGEAVMVSNSPGSNYFSYAKLTREQNRAKNKETLLEIINSESVSSPDKKRL